MSIIENIESHHLTEEKLASLIKNRSSFSVTSVENQVATVALIEKAIENAGLRCRIYTENRSATLATLLIPTGVTQITGLFSAVGIAAHNLANYNPDYEIGKSLKRSVINVTYKK